MSTAAPGSTIDITVRVPVSPPTLTPAERLVVDLVVQGKSNMAIAGQLCLSEKTVKNHLSRIYLKHGLSSRTELMAMVLAARKGELAPLSEPRPEEVVVRRIVRGVPMAMAAGLTGRTAREILEAARRELVECWREEGRILVDLTSLARWATLARRSAA